MLKIKTEIKNPQSKTKNILIVDDVENNIILLEDLLTDSGYNVVSAINGKDALEKLHAEKDYDLIVSDVLMPVMDGFMLCKNMKKDEKLYNIPFIFYTASYISEKDEMFALKLGADKFIRKPIEPDEFLKIVQGLLKDVSNGKRNPQEIAPEDDKDTLKLYNERLVEKLETKVFALENEIMERKLAEEVLRKSEEKYNRLIENLQDNYFFYSHDTEGIFTYLSPTITNILGYVTEEFLTHYSEYRTDNPSNEKVIKHTELSISGIKQPPYELEIYHKDGSRHTLKVQEVPVFDKNHNVIAVEGIAEDITERKRAENQLFKYQAQLKHISSALSLAEERERRNIAEDLHDRIGQNQAVIKMKLEDLRDSQVDTDSDRALNEIRELLDNAIQETRTLTFEISPPILYELGFEPAVEWLIEQFMQRHNIPIEYECNGNGNGRMLDDDVSFFLFKSVRELLFNVIKHAMADRIKVLVLREKNRIRISIEDDGVGFDFSKVQFSVDNLSSLGLFSIRERMEHFGGNIDIESKSGKGARITLIMSLKPEEEDWVKG